MELSKIVVADRSCLGQRRSLKDGEETAEQNIKAFIEWANKTMGVRDVYAALGAAILKGWRG
jgi:hypothetical protein